MSCPLTGEKEWIEIERSWNQNSSIASNQTMSTISLSQYELEDDKAIIWRGTNDEMSTFYDSDRFTLITLNRHYLNNTGDILKLWSPTGDLLDEVIIPACSQAGKSWTFQDGNWQESHPTPGSQNQHSSTQQNQTNTTNANSTSNTSTTANSASPQPTSQATTTQGAVAVQQQSSTSPLSSMQQNSIQNNTSQQTDLNGQTTNLHTTSLQSNGVNTISDTNDQNVHSNMSNTTPNIPSPNAYLSLINKNAPLNQTNSYDQSGNNASESAHINSTTTFNSNTTLTNPIQDASNYFLGIDNQSNSRIISPHKPLLKTIYRPTRSIIPYVSGILSGLLLTLSASVLTYSHYTHQTQNLYIHDTKTT